MEILDDGSARAVALGESRHVDLGNAAKYISPDLGVM